MIYTGIDLIEIARVERAARRWGQRFLRRAFVAGELADCGLASGAIAGGRWASLAARWAAKEAAAKALGVGLRGIGAGGAGAVALCEIEVRREASGKPALLLHGSAAARAAALGINDLAVSLSHNGAYAIASVVALASQSPAAV